MARKVLTLGRAYKTFILLFSIAGAWFWVFQQPVFEKKLIAEKRNKAFVKNKVSVRDLSLLSSRDLAKDFVKRVRFQYTLDAKKFVTGQKKLAVVYGNKQYGFYQLKNFSFNDSHDQIDFEFVPPGYKFPLKFFLVEENVKKAVFFENFHSSKNALLLGEKSFSRLERVVLSGLSVDFKGKFSSNFFLLSGFYHLPPDSRHPNSFNAYYSFILNKYGELVWAHLPMRGKKEVGGYSIARVLPGGVYALQFGERQGYFEIVNWKGEILKSVNVSELANPFVFHHDFVFHPKKKNKVLALGFSKKYMRDYSALWNSEVSLSQLLMPPMSYQASPLIEWDLETLEHQEVWDPFSHLQPLDMPYRLRNRIHNHRKNKGKRVSFWNKWGGDRADVDWMHSNSLSYEPNMGYLMSLRNLSKVILLSEDLKTLKWSVGCNPEDTYQVVPKELCFYGQHDAQFLENGALLIFDNHLPQLMARGAVEDALDYHSRNYGSRILILAPDPQKKEAKVIWAFTPPVEFKSGSRGSVSKLENGNLLAFYPLSHGGRDHILELTGIGAKTTGVQGNMWISFTENRKGTSAGGGARVVPINTIGEESFLR